MDTTTLLPLNRRSSDFSARLVLLFIPFIIQMNILPCWKTPAKAALYQILADFTADCGALLSIAVGKKCQLFQLSLSYQSALTALKYCRSSENGIAFFDDMTLEILLSSISEQEKKMLICKKRSLHFLMKKEICFRLTLKQICLFSEPARSCFFTKKHSAVQVESYLPEMRAESTCFQGCGAFISCLAVVIFLNPRHRFLCTHLPYPCTVLPI